MADLKTNYVDDVLDSDKNQFRKYQMIYNDDGTVSFVDVTTYTQNGDSFGAKDINDTNAAVNELNSNLISISTVIKTVTLSSNSGSSIIGNGYYGSIVFDIPKLVTVIPIECYLKGNENIQGISGVQVVNKDSENNSCRLYVNGGVQSGTYTVRILLLTTGK